MIANLFAGNAYLLGLPLGLDRPLFLLAALLVVLDPSIERLRPRAVFAVMGACVAWSLWSWISTGGVRETVKAFALADRVVVPFLMFALGALIFSTPARRTLLLKVLVVLGVYLGITAIGEISGTTALVWPHWILDPGLGIQFGRARGPFLYSEPMGMTGGLCLFAAGLLAFQSGGWWRRAAVVCVVLSLVTVVLSLTRTAWIGTLAAVVVVGLAVPRMRRWLPAVLAGLAALLVLLLLAAPSLTALLTERLTTERSVYDRALTNAAAGRIIETYPLEGVGWGRFVAVSPEFVRQADTYPLTNTGIEVHNVFLARAAETGLIGAALWGLAMLLGPIRSVMTPASTAEMQGWRVLALAGIVIWLFPTMLSPNNYPLPNNLVWLIGGIAGRALLVRPAWASRTRPPELDAAEGAL
ncbi:hypothetical protein ASF50_02755 [Nocardioides sp. Leaf307]|nr:hypothetical protein ASF50_02755 [Nocardioides sp. Leaf307]